MDRGPAEAGPGGGAGRCPAALAKLARGRLRAKLPALRLALTGRFSAHHGFLISEALSELDNLEESMSALAARIEQHLVPFAQQIEQLSTIPGVKRLAATIILSEVGTDMSCFPDTAHLASWAGMAPGNHKSAGNRRRAKARHGNRAPSWSSAVRLPGKPATPPWRPSTGA